MTSLFRPLREFIFRRNNRRSSFADNRDSHATVPSADLNPPVYAIARRTQVITPDATVGRAAELARSSPYLAVPVVDSRDGRFVGFATEASLSRALLGALDPVARDAVRCMPISSVAMEDAPFSASSFDRASDVAALMDAAGRDLLPVLDESRRFLGVISRGDLVYELVRPFRPPTIGGMATPSGVYLTTGSVSGGVSPLALVGTGVLMFAAQKLPLIPLTPLGRMLAATFGGGALASAVFRDAFPYMGSLAIFLAAIRLSPIAGYHAAEHQVVHAMERSEPLLVENVRAMPRVHPRCGTNLVAGILILTAVAGVIDPLLTRFEPSMAQMDLGYVFGAIIALAYWRTVGSFLQQHLTTRPATDGQIESGIRAARQVLERHGRDPEAPIRPHVRLWRMGMLQMALGLLIGYALLLLFAGIFPAAKGWIGPLSLTD